VSSAWDSADVAALRDLHGFWASLGIEADLLTGTQLRELEPALAVGLPGGLLARDDHEVDPRLLHPAMLRAAELGGARLVAATARVQVRGNRVTGVMLDDGTEITAATVVLAAGAWSGVVAGLPPMALPPVRPVKGQTLHLRPARPLLSHVVRASVKGNHIYLVPRESGDLIVGASVEEAGFDVRPRAGAVYDILRDAQTVLPELGEAELVEVRTGLRPGSPDNAPLIGSSALDGLVLATGHYRNGILLAPVTADLVTQYIATGEWDELAKPFTPDRFGTAVPS
jgi:glycine oxidase